MSLQNQVHEGLYSSVIECRLEHPNGTIRNSYLPNGVTNAVLALELLPKAMWWYLLLRSIVEKTLAPFNFAYISSVLGSGCMEICPAVMTSCCNSSTFLKSTHNLLFGGSLGADFLGTTTIGLAHLDMLLVIMPARSRDSISLCTHL